MSIEYGRVNGFQSFSSYLTSNCKKLFPFFSNIMDMLFPVRSYSNFVVKISNLLRVSLSLIELNKLLLSCLKVSSPIFSHSEKLCNHLTNKQDFPYQD